ncbi:MAG: winged helix-turn-helix domain-containing protein [Victivallales bacterium]|nr:winged helix-turn-helix domain-containing protein [Victivallales bacterium]
MNKASVKIKTLIDKLRGDIFCGNLKAGDKLPAIRKLMISFNLSQGSVTRGINVLCEQGLVVKKAGSGVYVRHLQSSPNQTYHIAVFARYAFPDFNNEKSMLACIYLGLKDRAGTDCKLTLINTTDSLRIPEDKLSRANTESDAIVLLNTYDSAESELDLNIPAIGIFMNNSYNGKLSLVGADPFDAARQAVEYFRKHQINQVHIISSKLPVFYFRAKIFELYWRQLNHSVLFSPADSVIDFRKDYGYFFSSDSVCQDYCNEFFNRTGRKLHEFTRIYSIDGKRFLPQCRNEFDSFPSYCVDWKDVGKYACEECIYRIKNIGTPGRRILVAGSLRENGEI